MSCDIPPGQPADAPKPHTWTGCSRIGCTAAAIVNPVILVWSIRTPHEQRTEERACRAVIPLPLCAGCQRNARIDAFLTVDGFERLQAVVRRSGGAPLDRASAKLTYLHILP